MATIGTSADNNITGTPGTAARGGPLDGLRVVDTTADRAGGVAGMLLADLGADVVRVEGHDGTNRRPAPHELPDAVCWDRGKRTVTVSSFDPDLDDDFAALLDDAHVVVVDSTPYAMEASPLHPDRTSRWPTLVTVWLPPYGTTGDRYLDLPSDPVLQAGITAFALHQPAVDPEVPIAPVISVIEAVQGSLGASAAVAGALASLRSGHGDLVTISGIDAAGALLATPVNASLDVEKAYSTTRNAKLGPFFRSFVCADGQELFLATLVATQFITALDVLDALHVMTLEGVDGEFFNLMRPDVAPAATVIVEERFATQPRDHWLERFAEHGVPAEPVLTRSEWLASDKFAATGGCQTFEHPVVGTVTTPSHPATIGPGPGGPRPSDDADPATPGWPYRQGPSGGPGPLAGLRVIDFTTFLAGPFGPALLAHWGADVVKVEPADGDAYRSYGVSYLAVNQAKHSARFDFGVADERSTFDDLVAGTDVLIDNLRPSARDKLDLGDDVLARLNPDLVHGNVTAFGPGPFVERPGFDPCIQALSGMMSATGGDDEPLNTSTPVHDVAAGASLVFGVLAGLWQRAVRGEASSVSTSLAAGASLLQCAELTSFEGRPEPRTGSIDYTGPDPAHRFYRAADGWIGVAAPTADDLLRAVGEADGDESPETTTASRVEQAIGARPVDEWLDTFDAASIPAASVVGATWGEDAYLDANGFTHVVVDPTFGRCRVMQGAGTWRRSGVNAVDRMVALGADNERLTTHGWTGFG